MQVEPASGKWRALALLGAAELLGMSLWFSASAVSPQLATFVLRWMEQELRQKSSTAHLLSPQNA